MKKIVNKMVRNFSVFHSGNKLLRELIERDNRQYIPIEYPRDKKLSVILYIGQLGSGGAERQLCNLAVGLQKKGYDVTVLASLTLEGSSGHFCPHLICNDIPVRVPEKVTLSELIQRYPDQLAGYRSILSSIPTYIGIFVFPLLNELLQNRPHILSCWMDYCNIPGGIAGIISDVPKIFFGGRNVNPSHLPLYQPWFETWYQILLKNKRVCFLNNSKVGAVDYARWLGIRQSRIQVIHNGIEVESIPEVSSEDITFFRDSVKADKGCPLIGGVFRFSDEKRPYDFIQVIQRLKEKNIRVKAVIAGIGTMTKEVKQYLSSRDLENDIILLGRRDDIFTVIKSCNLILHTSKFEGLPNALIEAQFLELPIVSTDAGGTPEIIIDGETGLLHPIGDIDGLTNSVLLLINDEVRAKEMGAQGRKHVMDSFSEEKMVGDYIDFFHNDNSEFLFNETLDKNTYDTMTFSRFCIITGVSFYLFICGIFLVVTGKVKTGFTITYFLKRMRVKVLGLFQRKTSGEITDIRPESGFCYILSLPEGLISDAEGVSSVAVYEDGKKLEIPHCVHDDIRNLGKGRYSHWGKFIYFSTSDNTDPTKNGRKYTFQTG